jgi:hypothetical protein
MSYNTDNTVEITQSIETPSELDFSLDGFSIVNFEFMCRRAQTENDLNEMLSIN